MTPVLYLSFDLCLLCRNFSISARNLLAVKFRSFSSSSWCLMSTIRGRCVSSTSWKCIISLDAPYFVTNEFSLMMTSGYSLDHSVWFVIGLSMIAALAAFLNFLTWASTVFPRCTYGKLVACCILYVAKSVSTSCLKLGSLSEYMILGIPCVVMYDRSAVAMDSLDLLLSG